MYRVYNSVSTTLSDASDAVTELSTASTLIAQYAPTVWHLLVVQDGNDADHVYMCVVRIDMMAGSQQFGYTPTIYVIIYPVFLKPWSFRNIAAMAVEVAFCVMVLGYMFAEVNCMRLLMRMPARGGGQQTRRKTQRYHPLLIYWFSLVNLLEWVSLLGSLVYLVFTWLSTVLLHPDRSKMADADWVLTQPQLEKIWAAGVLGTLFWTQLINLVIIGLLLLRYMFVHKGAQVILHMFQYALVPLKDVALFIVYISCVIGVALYGMYGSSGANSMFNSLSASLHSVLKLTFGFLSYEDFIKEPGLGRFNFLAAAAFWFCTLVLVIICQNIILAIVASCYEQARAEVGEENESFAFYFLHHFYCCCVVWARLYLLFQTRDSICRQYLRKLQSTEPYQVDPVMRNVVITMCIPEMRTLFLYCADTTGHVRYRAPILEAFQKCGGEGLYSSSYGSSTAGDLPPLDPKTMLAVFCAVFDTSGDEGSHFVNSTCKFRQLPTMRRPFLVPDDKRLVEIVGILFDAYSPEHAAGASGGGGDGSVDAYGGYKGGSSADRAAPAAAVALHARGGGLPWSTNAGSRKQHTRVHPDDGAKQKQ